MTWRDFLKPEEWVELEGIEEARREAQGAYHRLATRCRKRAERSKK